MRTLQSIRDVIAQITYPGFEFRVEVEDAFTTGELESPGRPWMQVVCPEGVDTVTGAPMPWKGRKWFLSYHMTDTEIVHTVWVAVQRALIHEACELFKFKDQAIFDRHINVNMLAEALAMNGAVLLDGRPDKK